MDDQVFTSHIRWTGNRGDGTAHYRAYDRTWDVAAPGKAPIPCSNDPMLGGDPAKMNPEDLLLSALAGCHMLWFLHYARGISNERLKNWGEAEADFRKALELNPGQPQVLNYLGYSLVEQHEKLDEALSMIEQAVAAQPQSGYIIDSLGWALYKLGRYEEAVVHMERAAELMAVDPVVNDDLGDVYWAVGRKLEAEFQWKRALSFIDWDNASDEVDPERIRQKLEVGLDEVLEEEGQPPLKMANGE